MSRESLTEAQFALLSAIALVMLAVLGSVVMTLSGMTPTQVGQIVVPIMGFAGMIMMQWRASVKTDEVRQSLAAANQQRADSNDQLHQEIQVVHNAVNSGAAATTKAALDASDAAKVLASDAAAKAEELAYERGRASREPEVAAAADRGFAHGHIAAMETINAVKAKEPMP